MATDMAAANAGAGGALASPPSKGSAFALWLAGLLLKALQIPDPPDTLKKALGALLARFGALLAFGLLVPPLCALVLRAVDKTGAEQLADTYRDYVVNGFRINESIYRADRERIDYLFQMRRVNFFEDDEVGTDPSVFISVIPRQQGLLVVERATLIRKQERAADESGGTGVDLGAVNSGKCPRQVNPNLQSVYLTFSDAALENASGKFNVKVGVPFQLDKKFWADMKIDPSAEAHVKSLRLAVLPPNAAQTRECFDLLVDLRVDIYKTRSK